MAELAILPIRRARIALASTNPRNAATCGLFDVAGRLGQAHRSPSWLCRYLGVLIADAGFPEPYPLSRGTRLTRSVHADSRWARVAVDAWFDGQLPPEAQAELDRVERIETDARLAASAARLFAGDRA